MTEAETTWTERIREWRASGLSARKFAGSHGWGPSTMRYWAKRLAVGKAAVTPDVVRPVASRVRMLRVTATVGHSQREPLTVSVRGVQIDVRRGFDASLLREVVDALGDAK